MAADPLGDKLWQEEEKEAHMERLVAVAICHPFGIRTPDTCHQFWTKRARTATSEQRWRNGAVLLCGVYAILMKANPMSYHST
jgi:hypothetical protein